MRFPNGYGSIVKPAGKRRKPFAVRVTADYAVDVSAQKATQKYKYIGYYEKRADAIRAELTAMAMRGEIGDSKTLVGLLMAERYLRGEDGHGV